MTRTVLLTTSVALAVACMTALLLTSVNPAWAAFPGQNGKIAFEGFLKSAPTPDNVIDNEIYTMNADGSEVVNITNSPSNDRNAAWSPDGERIAFESLRDGDFDIYVMNADGTGQTNLTDSLGGYYAWNPTWAPDGSKIAFFSNHDLVPSIYVMDADGGNVRRIKENAGHTSAPSWAPDGTKIAFRSRSDISTINVDGSGETNLTNSEGAENNPSWSPNGEKIAFETYRNGSHGVYVMNNDGTEQTLVSNVLHPSGWINPSWSPDGERIVFVRDSETGDEIVTINPNGSDLKVINKNPDFSVGGPDWQPLSPTYNFSGFYSPVDNLPTVNKAKAGSAIPMKFSLGGDQGLDIFAKAPDGSSFPKSGAMPCDSTDLVDAIEQTVSAGPSGLTYDAASDLYTYVWKTQKAWTGCRQLVVEFDDGTVERANFKFVK